MKQETIEYADGQTKLVGELFHEPSAGQKPGVIVFSAFEGRAAFALDYAKKLAEQGFTAFAADIYGEAKVANTFEGCYELLSPFLQEGGRAVARRRAVLAYEALLQQPSVQQDKVGAVGFCFGGMCALELARSGADISAIVSMHGLLTQSELPTHPIKSKILILHGYQDPKAPPETLQPFAKEMELASVEDWNFFFFGCAKHSFTDPKVGTFDAEKEKAMGREYSPLIAQRSFRYCVDFFNECLR